MCTSSSPVVLTVASLYFTGTLAFNLKGTTLLMPKWRSQKRTRYPTGAKHWQSSRISSRLSKVQHTAIGQETGIQFFAPYISLLCESEDCLFLEFLRSSPYLLHTNPTKTRNTHSIAKYLASHFVISLLL